MDRSAFEGAAFDAGRLAYVAVLAALVLVVDVTFLDLVGIESTTEAVVQFLTITVGAYVGMTLVDVALDADEDGVDEEAAVGDDQVSDGDRESTERRE